MQVQISYAVNCVCTSTTSMGKYSRTHISKNKAENQHMQPHMCFFCLPVSIASIISWQVKPGWLYIHLLQIRPLLVDEKEMCKTQGMFQGQHWLHRSSVSHWQPMHTQRCCCSHPLAHLGPAAQETKMYTLPPKLLGRGNVWSPDQSY